MKTYFLWMSALLTQSYAFSQNVGISTNNPVFKLDVRNGSINTDSVYRISNYTVLSVKGINSLFVGHHAGINNNGEDNTFSGTFSGYFNTEGFSNSFYGTGAGYNNTGGFFNSFFGAYTGFYNTDGVDNSFFGMQAGAFNTIGDANSYFGRSAGASNTIGKSNSFFGMSSGFSNTIASANSFFGDSTGFQNTTGNSNSFFGKMSGYNNTTGNNNTGLGYRVETGANNLVNATAIGANAQVNCSNCLVLGSVSGINGSTSGTNVGIGVNAPSAKLEVAGQVKITGGTPGIGKVLTSDANGLASWQPPTTPAPVTYAVVWICCNPWMTHNLDVSTYRNGDPIPKVTNAAAWASLATGAYCYYNNDSTTYAAMYGKMYNWYAVNDSRGLAPEGWHIPTDVEWNTLSTCLGGTASAGGPMKEIGTSQWTTPNTGATNGSGFNGLPGGYRDQLGSFANINIEGYLWSALGFSSTNAWHWTLRHNLGDLNRYGASKAFGLSIRCVKD